MTEMRIPGPDHPITLTPAPTRMRARYMGHVIADSAGAVMLKEASYKEVCYFPRGDVEMGYFGTTERSTHCPYKGDASYFTLRIEGEILENIAWSYARPYPAMEAIAGMIAFYPGQIEVYAHEEPGDRESDAEVAAIVEHTDSGSGASQAERWAPTGEQPR